MKQGRVYKGVCNRIASSDISPSCTHSLFMIAITPLMASCKEALSGGVTGSLGTGGLFSRGYIEVLLKFWKTSSSMLKGNSGG